MRHSLYLLIAALFISACQKAPTPTTPEKTVTKTEKRQVATDADRARYAAFRKRVNLRKSYKVYENPSLLAKATPENTKIVVDVSEQRARLLVDGVTAYDTPCTTGAKHKFEPNTRTYRDKHTPLGTYRIKEKIRNKRSTIFGFYYRGKRCVYRGDRRKFRGCKRGLRYVGHPLPYWMRITNNGIGLHESKYIKRYPGTNGCIRLPHKAAKLFFEKMKKGGTVIVQR